jgi:hypothetical protein
LSSPDAYGREHLRDELVNYLHFALTGENVSLNIPPAGAYLDAVPGGRDLFPGDTPMLGDQFICCIAIEGFPAESFPGILDCFDHLAIAYRWSTRMIYLDQHEALAELRKFRRKWKTAGPRVLDAGIQDAGRLGQRGRLGDVQPGGRGDRRRQLCVGGFRMQHAGHRPNGSGPSLANRERPADRPGNPARRLYRSH